MFRSVSRVKHALTETQCIEILKSEVRGHLSVLGDGGYPYVLPMNHWYNEEDGRLYFHSGMKGHKLDAMKANDKASFCVLDGGTKKDGDWALSFQSVIVFGRLQIVDEPDIAIDMIRKLSYHFTDNAEYIEKEIREAADHTLCFCLVPEHITGKRVQEK